MKVGVATDAEIANQLLSVRLHTSNVAWPLGHSGASPHGRCHDAWSSMRSWRHTTRRSPAPRDV